MIPRILAVLATTVAILANAQSTPATDFTDLWWNPAESGWGVSFTQHAGTNQVFAVWYTYDPRQAGTTGQNTPLWVVMPGGSWSSPTTISGTVYVANGMPFNQPGSNLKMSPVGTFTFNFATSSTGTFSYSIAPPAGLPSTDPAYNLPAMSGTKNIQRQSF